MTATTTLEQQIQAKGLTAPRITPADNEASIASEYYFSAGDGHVSVLASQGFPGCPRDGQGTPMVEAPEALELITICVLIMKNGHRIVGVNEGPVSAENFDPELGKQLARKKATEQIWPLVGFALRDRLASAQPSES